MWRSTERAYDKTALSLALSGIVLDSESKDDQLAVQNPAVFSY